MKFRRKFLLWKEEVTEGVDPGLVGADVIKTTGITIQPYAGNQIALEYDKQNFGANKVINVNPHVELNFGMMLASSGAAGTAPQWGEIIKACGFSETISAGVDVTYAPISDGITSGTGYFLMPQAGGVNDQVHESNGMRGSMSFNLAAGAFPRFDINMMGSYNTPVAAASVTGDDTGWTDPVAPTLVNTPTVTLDGAASCLQSVQFNSNTQVEYLNIPGCSGAKVTDAQFGGNMVIRSPDLATKDFFTDLVENDAAVNTGAMQIVHGATAGAIIQLDFATLQVSGVSLEEIAGDVAYNFTFVDVNNSMTITVK